MKEFIKLCNYGQLYIDKIIFESAFPVIFTCVNNDSNIFICVCCQANENGCKWLIGKTDGKSIVKMLRDEITVRQLLLEYSSGKISVDYVENQYTVAYGNSDWDENSLFLPKVDSYMYAEDGEFDEEIAYFSSMDYLLYDTKYYKCLFDTVKSINKGLEPITEALTVAASIIGNFTMPGQIVNTLKANGKVLPASASNTRKYLSNEKYTPFFSETITSFKDDSFIKIKVDDNIYADAA